MAFKFPNIDPRKPGFKHVRFLPYTEWVLKPPAHGLVGIMLGSESDWPKVVAIGQLFDRLQVNAEVVIASAHRTAEDMREYARSARGRGIEQIVAVAGGSAHLQAMSAAFSSQVPVFGVGVKSSSPDAVLGSNTDLPSFSPPAFMGFNEKGAINAGLIIAQIRMQHDTELLQRVQELEHELVKSVRNDIPFEN